MKWSATVLEEVLCRVDDSALGVARYSNTVPDPRLVAWSQRSMMAMGSVARNRG